MYSLVLHYLNSFLGSCCILRCHCRYQRWNSRTSCRDLRRPKFQNHSRWSWRKHHFFCCSRRKSNLWNNPRCRRLLSSSRFTIIRRSCRCFFLRRSSGVCLFSTCCFSLFCSCSFCTFRSYCGRSWIGWYCRRWTIWYHRVKQKSDPSWSCTNLSSWCSCVLIYVYICSYCIDRFMKL